MSNEPKVAIVTGASQGIGAGIVKGYRDNGYVVAANSRTVKTAVARFGRIDTLINDAGVFIGKPFTEYTADDFRNAIDVNVAGFFHITQLVIGQRPKQGRGHIVPISTALVYEPSPSA